MAVCPICHKRIGHFNKVQVKDAVLCKDCGTCWGYDIGFRSMKEISEFKQMQYERFHKFTVTRELSRFWTRSIYIDEGNRLFYCGEDKNKYSPPYGGPLIFSFNEVIGYHYGPNVVNVETKIKGGAGRAIVGGLLFGTTGAVVGAATNKQVTNVTSSGGNLFVEYKTVMGRRSIQYPLEPDGFVDFLDRCIEENSKEEITEIFSPADEIKKYKELLDMGAITEEEYNLKKKQLLGV